MKKITAVLLTVLALLLFTACGGGSSSDTTAVNPETVDFTQPFHPFHFYASTFFTNETDL